jgi:hypothetical protein
MDMKTRILILLAVGFACLFAGAAWSRTDSPPRYTPSSSSPGYTPSYTPKLERPQPPKTYNPKFETPQAPHTYTPSGPTFSNRR